MIYQSVETNGGPHETGALMHEMVRRFRSDMSPYAHLSLNQVYTLIRNLPFNPDPEYAETLQRPLYTMQGTGLGGDCDDKSIALASYAANVGIPYRFVAVRRFDQKELHHVYPELYIAGKWVPYDPTYSVNVLGRTREQYAEYVIL